MLRTALKLSLIGLLFGPLLNAHAEVHFQDARTWRRAKVISPGQQVWSFLSSYQNVSDRFSTNGEIEKLGAMHTRSITWGQLLAAEKTPAGKAQLSKYMG